MCNARWSFLGTFFISYIDTVFVHIKKTIPFIYMLSTVGLSPAKDQEVTNHFQLYRLLTVVVSEGLRELFKREWDRIYGRSIGVWDDTIISGNVLYNKEKMRQVSKRYLALFKSGDRSKWDFSTLIHAILYSNALKMHLPANISQNVNELRQLRNELVHSSVSRISDSELYSCLKKIRNSFEALDLPTADIQRIKNNRRGNRITSSSETVSRYLITSSSIFYFIVFLFALSSFILWVAKPTETLFNVLPSRPVHLVANRSRTVTAIVEEMHLLSTRNNRALTYCYLSGNSGSGTSQLARLVGQRYEASIPRDWFGSSLRSFVMTLDATSVHGILESYADFARHMDCNENNIASILHSNQRSTEMKIKSLKTEIAKTFGNSKHKYNWLLIVDNVVKLSEISVFLPRLQEEVWKGGQVLITTRDVSSVPSNSSLTVHISVSRGMDPTESTEFLAALSGVVENQDLLSEVAKTLDYQPLALAAAAYYVKELRENKVSQFTWADYLKKLDEGKRNLTERRLSEVNQAYPLTMSTAILLAVRAAAETNYVLKHSFSFFSFVSYEALPLEVLVSYILTVDKNLDADDVALRIMKSSLILSSGDCKVTTIWLHRVVYDSIKVYISDTEQNVSSVQLTVLQLLLSKKFAYGVKALIPHLKAFFATARNLSLDTLVPDSMQTKQEIREQIYYLTKALTPYREFLLSKKLLQLAANQEQLKRKVGMEGNGSYCPLEENYP